MSLYEVPSEDAGDGASLSTRTDNDGLGAQNAVEQVRVELEACGHELDAANEQLRLIFENAPNGIVTVDSDGIMQMVNASMERMFGYVASELIGNGIDMLVPDAFRHAHEHHRQQFFARPDVRRMGQTRWLEVRRKDGSDIAIEVTLTPLSFRNSSHAMAFVIDVTCAKHIEIERDVIFHTKTESQKLHKFGAELQGLENQLPIDPKYRNPKIGGGAPIRVVNVVFSSGEGNSGVQTAAFNLPNDERVVAEKGSKRVMLKNVQEAKFAKTLVPISRVVLAAKDQKNVKFDAFFTHVLMHELLHGIGPSVITVDGRQTTVRGELKELYSAIEEAKADISGLWALQTLVDKGVLDRQLEQTMYTTFLSSIFRSVRFGIKEAHGKGVAIQFNYLIDEGAIRFDPKTGTFAIVPEKIRDGVRKLTAEILTLQAEGSYAKAKALIDKYGIIRPEMQGALDRLKGVPVDIEPIYPMAKYEVRQEYRIFNY